MNQEHLWYHIFDREHFKSGNFMSLNSF